jgi:hypothetical protein
VENRVDPKADKEVVETELILKDLELVDSKIAKMKEEIKKEKKNTKYYDLLLALKAHMEKGNLAIMYDDVGNMNNEDVRKFRHELALLTDKPFIYILNSDELNIDKEAVIAKYKNLLKINDKFKIIPLNIKQEYELSCLDKGEKEEMKQELGLEVEALNDLIKESYSLLGLLTFFTAGEKEVRGWTIEKGSKAPQVAGTIHTDFEKKFIAAEVTTYQDFVKYKGWVGVKNSGRMRIEGREYVFKDGDVAIFKHGA